MYNSMQTDYYFLNTDEILLDKKFTLTLKLLKMYK